MKRFATQTNKVSPAQLELGRRSEPDLVAILAQRLSESRAQSQHDLPIVFGHFLRPKARTAST